MRKCLLVLGCAIMVASLCGAGTEGKVYGEGVDLEEAVAISQLSENPNDYVGKTVRVDGVITGVCAKRGCWMQVSDPETGLGVRVKVEDGVIVFPATSKGRKAQAQGVFEVVEAEAPAATEKKASMSKTDFLDEKGETCDKEDSLSSKVGCDAPVQKNLVLVLRGTGAVIF